MTPAQVNVNGVESGAIVAGAVSTLNAPGATINNYGLPLQDCITDYYMLLATECKLHTVHAATGGEPAQQMSPRTAQVYVTPDVWIAEKASKKSKPDGMELETRKRVPLTDCLASTEASFRRVVLTASSGMGKTTTVNMQVVELARTGSAPWMVLRLPALLGLDFAGAKLVEKALERDIQLKVTKSAEDSATIARELIKRLDAKQGVILFDALDEVPEAERPRVLSAVTEFLDDRSDEQSGHRIVLTSRPYAYQGASLLQLAAKGFTRVELAPFTPEQRDALIDQFFSKVVNSSETGNAMKWQVASSANGDIATLLEEPMLLTYACMLAAARADGEAIDGAKPVAPLPNTRYKLFDGLVSLMLEKWDSRRVLGLVNSFRVLFEPGFGRSALRKILEQAAYWEATWEATQRRVVRDNQMSVLDAPKIRLSHDTLVRLTDDAMPCDLPVRARVVVNWLAERSGLIRRVEEGGGMGYQLHKQLASFLAVGELRASSKDDHEFAHRLVETMRSDAERFRQFAAMGLARLADNPLALAHARDTVLQFPKGDDREPVAAARYWETIAVFAVAQREVTPANFHGTHDVLETNRDRERALLIELIETQRLTPALRAEVADALGAMGDPRFDEEKPHQWTTRVHDVTDEPLPGFVRVPQDFRFTMGDERELDNRPRKVNIVDPFYIARALTTVAQYAKFVEAKGYGAGVDIWGEQGLDWRNGQFDSKVENKAYKAWLAKRTPDLRTVPWDWAAQREYPSRPVTGVTWFEARAYTRWLNALMRQDIESVSTLKNYAVTLPTEDQWERAARAKDLTAADERRWPWVGDDVKEVPQRANVSGSGIEHVSAVGVFAPNPIGLFDMAGNAWEWMDNLYADSTVGFARVDIGRDLMTHADLDECDRPALRGGSWFIRPVRARCSSRNMFHPDNWNDVVGFRVVLSLVSSSET